jgi:hypothetical protein
MKTPPFSTTNVALLALVAPMVAVLLSLSVEPAPLIVTVPLFSDAVLATLNEVPVTLAPLWMLSVPTLPMTVETSTEMALKAPVLPLLKVMVPVDPLRPIFSTPPLELEPTPSIVTVPFPPEFPIRWHVPELI